MKLFIRGEIQRRLQDGFSIRLPMAEAVRIFVEKLKLYHIATPPQAQRQPRLILNL